MEKDTFLVACRNALKYIAIAILLSGCAMPRIVVLHDPLSPEEHINLGVAYEKKGEMDAALSEYREAERKAPVALLYAGNIYFQKGMLKEAEEKYRKAIEKTKDPRAYNNLAWLYLTTGGSLDEASRLARKAVELSPESADFKDTLDRIEEKRAGSGAAPDSRNGSGR